jgi:hypothetical protein
VSMAKINEGHSAEILIESVPIQLCSLHRRINQFDLLVDKLS